MKKIENQTGPNCIKFVERNNEANYVNIINKTGCWSHVGNANTAQDLSLGFGCVKQGTVMHELLHALGFVESINCVISYSYELVIFI